MEILSLGKRFRRAVSTLILVLLMIAIPLRFAGQERDEYAVKAEYIFYFSKFVDWPPTSVTNPFAICLLGDDPFEGTIDQLTKGKSVYGRLIQIRRLKEPADAKLCQIVFVSFRESIKAARLIDAVRGLAVLTVGESQEFLRTGGMIAMFEEDGRVTITINIDATQNSNVKVSANLLQMAKKYRNH